MYIHTKYSVLAKVVKRVGKTSFFRQVLFMWSQECVKTTIMI